MTNGDRSIPGACSRLEMACDRPLLWCACRHHVYELMAKAAWNAFFPGASVCPGEKLIQEFASWWSKQDPEAITRRRTAADRPNLFEGFEGFDECIDDFRKLSAAMRANGKSAFPRNDYEEMMEFFEVSVFYNEIAHKVMILQLCLESNQVFFFYP